MAQNIGDLYFSLGLDTSKLDSQWNRALRRYVAANKATIKLNIEVDTAPLKNLKKELEKLKKEIPGLNLGKVSEQLKGISDYLIKSATSAKQISSNLKSASSVTKGLNKETKETSNNLLKHKSVLSGIVSMMRRYVSLAGMISLGKSIIRITGEIEYQRRALESVMQNTQKANEIWSEIQNLAVKSPFQVGDLLKYSKQLSAFGIENEHLFDTLKRLADVSAGLGVDLSRIALAYGEINAATVLRGKETRQLTQAGIPIIKELAKTFSELEGRMVSAGEVYKRIFSRQVSFDMVKKVFTDLTSEGGKFYQMQEKQAATLKGMIKNIADQWTLMANQIGESNSGWIKTLVMGLRSVMSSWQSWIGAVKIGIGAFAIFKATAGAAELYSTISRGLNLIASGGVAAAKGLAAISSVSAGWIGIIATLVVLLGKWAFALNDVQKIQKVATDTQNKWAAEQLSINTQLDYLYRKLQLATRGTKEYEEAEKAIIRSYPEYFDKIREEGREIGDLTEHYVSLRDTALEAARARMIVEGQAQAKSTFDEANSDLIKDALKSARKFSTKGLIRAGGELSQAERYTVQQYLMGGLIPAGYLLPALGLTKENGWKWSEQDTMDYLYGRSNALSLGEGPLIGKIKQIRGEILKNRQAYEETLKNIEDLAPYNPYATNYEESPDFVGPVLKKVEGLLKWQENIRTILSKYGKSDATKAGALWVDEKTNLNDYVESLGKIRAGLVTELSNYSKVAAKGDDYKEKIQELNNSIKAIDEIKKTYGFSSTKEDSERLEEEEKQTRDRIHLVDEQLQWVEAIRHFYQELKDLGLSPEEAQKIISSIYSGANLPKGYSLQDVFNSDYNAVLKKFISLYAGIGGEEAMKASNNAQQKLANNQMKEQLDIHKAQKKLQDDLKEWGAQDFIIEGESGLEKLSRLMAELSTKQQKLELKKEEKLAEARRLYSGEQLAEQERQINRLYNLERQYNIDIYKQKVESFGETFAKKAATELNKAFTNAGKKSINYLKSELAKFRNIAQMDFGLFGGDVQARILENGSGFLTEGGAFDWNSLGLMTDDQFARVLEDSTLSRDQRENLKVLRTMAKNGQDLNVLAQVIAKKLNIDLKNAEDVTNQKDIALWNSVLGGISSLGGTIGGKAGSIISNLSNAAKTVYNAYAKEGGATTSDYISMILEGAQGMYSAISGLMKKNRQTVRDWKNAINEATQAARKNAIAQKEYKQTNVWGVENSFTQLRAAAQQYWTARSQFASIAQSLAENGKYRYGIKKVIDTDTTVNSGLGGGLMGAGIGGLIGEGYGALIGGIIGLVAGTAAGASTGKKTITVKKLTDLFGHQFYNPKTLELNQQILNDYARMNDETKKLIDNWEEIREEMQKAEEEMENQIKELTGNLGTDIKDMLVKAFSDGDIFAAIDDIDEYLGGKVKEWALQNAFAAVFGGLFDDLQARMKASFDPTTGDYDLTDDILSLRQVLPQYTKVFGSVLELLQSELSRLGIDSTLSSGSTTSSGISAASLTEDTGSRIVAMANAIRADVSVNRSILESYMPNVGTINDNIASGLVTLRDIEVNTRRGADLTGEIRDFLSSMMGVSNTGAGYALNVNIG